jgi:cell division protein FtsL
MSIEEKVPMSRTSITIVVVILLCAAGFVYSQGWFNWSSSSYEVESDTVSTDQIIDQEKTKVDAAHVTQQTKEPAATLTE